MKRALLILPLLISACTITEISRVNTGLFDGDLKKLSEAYEKVDKMERGKATRADVEAIGFNLGAPNIERIPGPAAFRRIFGDTVFQNALGDPKNAQTLLKEMQQYKAHFVPYKDIATYTDRYYFSTKETLSRGDDLLIMILFKNDTLFYSDYRYVKIDSRESTHAFAQGIIDVIKEYLGPTDALYDLVTKLKDDFKNKDD